MKTNLRQSVVLQCRRRFDARIFWRVFIVMMIAIAIYASRQTRLYEARGALKIEVIEVRNEYAVIGGAVSCGIHVNTIREVLASQKILQLVIERLTAEERVDFLEPYGPVDHSDEEIKRLILANRILTTDQKKHFLEIRYRHPDRHVASRVVDLFLSEFGAYDARVRTDETAWALKELEQRAEQARQHAEICERAASSYRENLPEMKEAEREKDEKYQALIKKTEIGKNLHKLILERLADTQAFDKNTARGWRISQPPVTPAEDDYLPGTAGHDRRMGICDCGHLRRAGCASI